VTPSLPPSAGSRPQFSILLPIYNGARYVGSALETVQAQSFAGWELIVVDDGSTDQTPAILHQAPADPRRVVIHQANRGLAAARNRAMAAAR
jgi:glycosyltransferase involved in cell wall biosynthesis